MEFHPFRKGLPKHITLADQTVEDGYTYFTTSTWWKKIRSILPCFRWIDWPGYASASLEVPVSPGSKETFVIQCWKGWCGDIFQDLHLPWWARRVKFPGGVGAEVGIYTRKPPWDQIDRPPIGTLQPLLAEEEQQPSEPLIDVPVAMSQWWERMRADIRSPDPFKIWWPDKNAVADSGSPVSFSLYDRNFGDALTKEYSTPTYWTCKWMATPSFNGANNTTHRDR